jgi:hypothetical protein
MWKSLKRWPVLLVLLFAVGALVVALHYLAYGNRVTRANCERVYEGMTMEEVRAILGRPWGNSLLDPEGPSASDMAKPLRAHIPDAELCDFWMGTDVGIFVAFDGDFQVIHTELCTDPDLPRSWLPARVWRRLRARFGW